MTLGGISNSRKFCGYLDLNLTGQQIANWIN